MFFRFRSVMASVCALALILAFAPTAGVVVAQETITGELSGVSISIGEGWSHDADVSASSGGIDALVFSNGNTQFVVSGGTSDLGASLDMFGISHTVTDIDVAATYALRGADAEGTPFGIFQVVVGSNVQSVIAPVSTFADAVTAAQAGIQIDGASVLGGVDGAGLAAAIAGSMGSGDAAADISAPALLGGSSGDELVEESDTEVSVAEEATEETTDTAEAEADVPEVAPGETGFVDTNTFVSPQFGTTVTWNDSWQPWLDADGSPRFSSEVSEFGAYDSLCLDTTDPGAFWSVCFDFESPNEFTAERFATYSDPESNSSYGIPHFGVVLTDTAVSYTSTDLEGNARVIQEEVVDGVLVETRLYSEIEEIASIVEMVQGGIQVDGNAAYSLLDASTYRAEMDTMIASIPALIAEREESLAAMGLQDPNHYVSTAYGCDVAWPDSHYMSQLEMNPVTTYEEWFDSTGESVQVETFYLSALEPPYIGYLVECFENIPDLESWWMWTSDPEAQRIEGERAIYLVRSNGDSLDVFVIVKPVGEPTLVVRFFASADDIAAIQAGEFSGLILGGIDMSEFMQEDDLVSQLP